MTGNLVFVFLIVLCQTFLLLCLSCLNKLIIIIIITFDWNKNSVVTFNFNYTKYIPEGLPSGKPSGMNKWSERSSIELSEYILFQIQKIFFIYKNQSIGFKKKIFKFFLQFFFKLPKFSDFIYSEDCIGKITLKSIRL